MANKLLNLPKIKDNSYKILEIYKCANCKNRVTSKTEKCGQCGGYFSGEIIDEPVEIVKTKDESKNNKEIEKNNIQIKNDDNALVCQSCKCIQKSLEAKYCRKCGESLFPDKMIEVIRCPKCKTEYDEGDEFCDVDGTELVTNKIQIPDHEHPNFKLLRDSKVIETNQKYDAFEKSRYEITETREPMKWHWVVTYLFQPIRLILSMISSFSVGMFINLVTYSLLIFGLHNYKSWSWKAYLFIWGGEALYKLILPWFDLSYRYLIIDNLDGYYIPKILFLLSFIPQFIYYKKRSHLFKN